MSKLYIKLLIIFVCINASVNLKAQDKWLSLCKSDRVQRTYKSTSETWYSRLDFCYDERAFGDYGRITTSNFNFWLKLIRLKPYATDHSGCSEVVQYPEYFHQDNATVRIKLYRNNSPICTIVENQDYSSQASITAFENSLENFTLPENIVPGNGYQLKIYVSHTAFSSYYDPFAVGFSYETGTFTIGETSKIISPVFRDEHLELTPTFKWNKLQDAQYRLIIGSSDSPPVFTRNDQGTYTVTNTLYDSQLIADTCITTPENILNFENDYYIGLITSFNGVQFRIEDNFQTRAKAVLFKETDFYNNVSASPSNLKNYISPSDTVRFKLKLKNELADNLIALNSKLICNTDGVIITSPNASYNISSNSDGWSLVEYEIYISESVASGTMLDFSLETSQAFAPTGPWTTTFSFPVAPLVAGSIYIDDDSNPDSNGDNDQIAEPSETVELFPFLNNVCSVEIANVRGELSSPHEFITIWDGLSGIGNTVHKKWRYNIVSGQHDPIIAEAIDIQPEYDFVFDYSPSGILTEFNLNIEVSGEYNGTLMKWNVPVTINEGQAVPECSIPLDFTAESISSNEISLNWTSATNASSYDVYTCNGELIGNTKETSYVVSALEAETAYSYKILAKNSFHQSGFTSCLEATTKVDIPELPTNFVVDSKSSSELQISWDASLNATSYDVFTCNNDSITNTNLLSHTIADLLPGTKYEFKVRSRNANGLSDFTVCKESTTQLVIPASPKNLTAVALSGTEISLNWETSDYATGYDIYYCNDTVVGYTSQTEYVIPNLKPESIYSFKVSAKNDLGNSALTSCEEASTLKLPELKVTPSTSLVNEDKGSANLTIENIGEGSFTYNAVSNSDWIIITNGNLGNNDGIVTFNFDANPGTERIGTITVTAQGSVNSPYEVTITQNAALCNPGWEPVIYTNSTTAYGIVTIEGEPASVNDLVGAFINDECRSVQKVIINEGVSYVNMVINGEVPEMVNFKIWDVSECDSMDVAFSTQSDPGGELGYTPNFLPIAASNCQETTVNVDASICEGENFTHGSQTLTMSGEYIETFTSQGGCDSIVVLNLVVKPLISVDFSFSVNDTIVVFNNESVNANSYLWSFGDGNTSIDENPVNIYHTADEFIIELTAYNSNCQESISKSIVIDTAIKDISASGLVKVFPNPSDGIYRIVGDGVNLGPDCKLQLYNTSGQLVLQEQYNAESLDVELDISNRRDGVYILKLSNDRYFLITKLIKQ